MRGKGLTAIRRLRHVVWGVAGVVVAGMTLLALTSGSGPQAVPHPGASNIPSEWSRLRAGRSVAAPDLTLEQITLRAAVAAEQARLDAFSDARTELSASLDRLREEVATLQAKRDALAQASTALPLPGDDLACMVSLAAANAAPAEATQPPAPRVVVHHRAGSSTARRAAELVAEEARRAGATVAAIQPETEVPNARVIHPATTEDAELAGELATRFRRRWGHPWRVEGAQLRAEAPPPRTLEIWLPH